MSKVDTDTSYYDRKRAWKNVLYIKLEKCDINYFYTTQKDKGS